MTAPPHAPFTGAVPPDVVEQLIQAVVQAQQGEQPSVDSLSQKTANQKMEPNPPDESDSTPPVERRKAMMAALYGPDFPLIAALDQAMAAGEDQPDTMALAQYTEPGDWCSWARQRWEAHRSAVATHLWLVQRNRLYRAGQQWVSSKGRGPWREPPRQAESARIVHNLESLALDQRLQIITDQRPGFEVDPASFDPDDKRKATARQQALEFIYDAMHMEDQARNAAYWAGTDGTAFWHVYWDRDAGPWDERMGGDKGRGQPLGDLRTQTLRCEQVRVSSNATATEEPLYVVLRDIIPEQEAAWLYGDAAIQKKAESESAIGSGAQLYEAGVANWVMDVTNPGEAERMRNVPTAERFTIYVDRHPDTLPEGLQMVVVGDALVWGPDDLQFGVIPVVPVRDGSTDPSYFPRPIVEQWHDHQMQLNAALSLVVNSIRVNASGRIAARPGAITRETFVGGSTSIIEVEGAGPLADQLMPLQGFSVGQDVKDYVTLKIKAFEDASGFNDISRGQIDGDQSGRALLAAREQLERVFAPPVQAVAKAYMHWGRVVLAGMAWGYDMPRDLGVLGKGRPDLARALSAKDFEGPSTVRIEEESMMPMPRVYRMFLLDGWHEKGLITNQQYLRRVEFGIVDDISTPDEDQEARAKRVADAIRLGMPREQIPPMRWQDNEAIFQDVLEREILLQDDLPPEVIQVADEIWKGYAAQAQQKQPQTAAPPDPASPEGQYQQFTAKISQQAVSKAEALISQAISAQDFGAGVPAPMGAAGDPNVAPPAQQGDNSLNSVQLPQSPAPQAPMGDRPALPPPQPAQQAPQSPVNLTLAQPDLGRLAEVIQQLATREQAPPQIVVNVPQQPAPVVNIGESHHHIAMPEMRPPDVHVHEREHPKPEVHIVNAPPSKDKKKSRFHEFTDESGKKWKVKSRDAEDGE